MHKVAKYRLICQKNDEENYLLDKYLFRRFSIYITILFIKLRIKANAATFLSLVAALGSLYFLLFNTPGMMLAAAFLVFSYYVLDHVDGELARYYRHRGLEKPSLHGHYFDLLVHRYSSNLMVFFMGLGVYRQFEYPWAVLLGFAACMGISSFPNVIAAQVLAARLAYDPALLDSAKIKAILALLERKEAQARQVRGGYSTRLKKLLAELLFFPGHVILIIVVLLADTFFPSGIAWFSFSFNFRLLLVAALALLFVLKTVIQGYLWIVRFRDVG